MDNDHTYIKLTPWSLVSWGITVIVTGIIVGLTISHFMNASRYNDLESYIEQDALMLTFTFIETNNDFMYSIGEEEMTIRECIERSNTRALGTRDGNTFQVRTFTCLKNSPI